MRISDWSSDVCSSDLHEKAAFEADPLRDETPDAPGPRGADGDAPDPKEAAAPDDVIREPDDVEPDTTDGESGEAVQVTADGEQTTMDAPPTDQIGRASCRARVCQYV